MASNDIDTSAASEKLTAVNNQTVIKTYAARENETDTTIDDLLSKTPQGTVSGPISNTFYGINHRNTPLAIPQNRDYYGLVFFTRPDMNMMTSNLRGLRKLVPLLSKDENSIGRILRCMFDHRLLKNEGIKSKYLDNLQAFMPLLTNTALSMSGWPDVEVQTFTSTPGVRREVYAFVDDFEEYYGALDITVNFRNVMGDPITTLFLTWIRYMSAVFRSDMVPYVDNIITNSIDYQTRIYRVVLDHRKKVVTKIAATAASFPTAISIGGAFDFEHDRPINASNDQISVRFHSIGAIYQDELLIDQFNKTVQYFNAAMKDMQRTTTYIKIPDEFLQVLNHRGYPRIDPTTHELEWWVDKSIYNSVVKGN